MPSYLAAGDVGLSFIKRCFSKRYLTFALARSLQQADDCSLWQVSESFAQTGDLKQLIAAVVKTDAFRLRAAEDLGDTQ